MENTAGTSFKAYNDEWTPDAYTELKQSTFTGYRTRNGKPTQSYLKHIKQHPDEKNLVEGKVYNPATKRFVNADQFYDKRAKTKTLKKGNKIAIVEGKLTNKPSSKKVIRFTPTAVGDTPRFKDLGFNKDTRGVYWIKVYRQGQQVGQFQVEFSNNPNNNRRYVWEGFMNTSDENNLETDVEHTIEVYSFNQLAFTREKMNQVYADNNSYSCILEPIKQYLEERPCKTNDEKLYKVNNLIQYCQDNKRGLTKEEIQEHICGTKLKFGVCIMTIDNRVIEKLKPIKEKSKYIFYYYNTLDNHVEYAPNRHHKDMKNWTYFDFVNEAKNTVTFDTAEQMNNLYKKLKDTNQCFKFNTSTRIQGFNGVNMIETGDCVYNLEDPTLELKQKLFKEYPDVFSKMTCKVEDYQGSVIQFIKNATYVNGLKTFNGDLANDVGGEIQEHDITKAYATFYQCPYYKQYGIPGIPTDFRDCQGVDPLTVINKIGWTKIRNISGSGNAYELANLIEDNVYPNVELKCLWDFGVRFDCVTTAWCLNKKDFRFSEEYLDGIDHPDYVKIQNDGTIVKPKAYAIIVGMMLGASCETSFCYHYSKQPSQEWINNLAYHDDKLKMVYNNTDFNNMIFKQEKYNVETHVHVSSYITAYVRTRMYQEIEKRDINDLYMVCSDALKFKGDYILPEGFKDKTENIWLGNSNESFSQYHNEQEVTEYRVDEWKDQPQFVFYNGAGGCGKTTSYMNSKYPFKVLTMPTNELKAEKSGDIDCYTHHHFFKLQVPKKVSDMFGDLFEESKTVECRGLDEYEYYNIGEVFVDEITMRSRDETDKMIGHAKKYGYRLIFAGDIDRETKTPYQLQPVHSKFDFNDKLFTFEEFVTNYRIQDKVLLERVNKIRAVMKSNLDQDIESHEWVRDFTGLVLKIFKDRKFDEKYMFDNFDSTKDLCITGRNKNKNRYNKVFDEKCENKIWKLTRKVKNVEKGKIVFGDIETKCKELCFSTSIHGVQGKTFVGNLYINTRDVFEFGMLYTAISRVKSLEQVYLIC